VCRPPARSCFLSLGLRSFLDGGLHAPFGVLVTRDDDVMLPDVGPRIVVLPLSSALLLA